MYAPRDTTGRSVAIKVLLPQISADFDARQRFEREARAIANLNHPNICTLHDIGSADGVDYIVMEYSRGTRSRNSWRRVACQWTAFSPTG